MCSAVEHGSAAVRPPTLGEAAGARGLDENEPGGAEQVAGLSLTPQEQIELRLDKLREGTVQKGVEALLVVQKMDLFYVSDTTQDASSSPASRASLC
jgi:hypothetical protein